MDHRKPTLRPLTPAQLAEVRRQAFLRQMIDDSRFLREAMRESPAERRAFAEAVWWVCFFALALCVAGAVLLSP